MYWIWFGLRFCFETQEFFKTIFSELELFIFAGIF